MLKSQFLLDPDVVFLNHGSFGATPRPVFDVYQKWQRQLEKQPVQFVLEELPARLQESRQALGTYLHTDKDNFVLIPNTTYGVNVIARALDLKEGDEVLMTDHEYGACRLTWQFLSQKHGFQLVEQPIDLPAISDEAIVEQLWQGVTDKTKVIFFSHITSFTALTLPAQAICARARSAGILTLVDGAHVPGQIPLDLTTLEADFYAGNCHKWLCAPKGSAFLYTQPDKQHLVEPLIVSWGWGDPSPFDYGSDYLNIHQWVGTKDPAAYLSVPAAIDFQAEHDWDTVRQQCREGVRDGLQRINDLTGLAPCYTSDHFYCQMGIASLPPIEDLIAFKNQLYQQYKVEIPLFQWQDHQFIRICLQGYNTPEDVDRLLQALEEMLPII